ncbi:MAG: class I SAM-dependent methyltransferase [bacterium]
MKGEACKLCAGTEYSVYLPRVYVLGEQTFDLLRCRECGLVRVAPMLNVETVRSLYTNDYFDRDFSCGVRKGTYLETEATRVNEYREVLEGIKRHRRGGKLLEIGCAGGSFLNYARRSGYEVEGVDISEWAAKTAREQFGLTVHHGRLMETRLPAASFDIIFMGDLLEHEPEPVEFLTEVKRLLKPDGMTVIKVPTYMNSFYYRTARLLPISWTLGRLDNRLLTSLKLSKEFPSLPPYHLYEYSLDTLSQMCKKTGLRVISHRNSLLVPEFLAENDAPWQDRLAHIGFRALRYLVRRFNFPAGHVMVFAVLESR